MSSDMMVICKEDDSGYEGEGTSAAFFIDECSMGEPWHGFGDWFRQRYCGHPSIIEQMCGVKEHRYIELTEHDVVAIKSALEALDKHERLDESSFMNYIKEHVGKHISTENW